MNKLTRLLDLIYPRICAACRKPLGEVDTPICINCIIDLPVIINDTVQQRKIIQKFDGKVNINDAKSYLLFEKGNVAQQLIHGLKYQNKKSIGVWLGKKFGEALINANEQDKVDLIVPIPMHETKQKQRGYNQAELIAEGMASVLNVPIINNGLIKIANTSSQTKKDRYQRYKNTNEIFQVNTEAELRGKRVCLVDDVLTTGATLEAAAIALIEYDCEVSIKTIASAF
jgi:ComF family protein